MYKDTGKNYPNLKFFGLTIEDKTRLQAYGMNVDGFT
jgi:hypothetical protein